MASENQGMMLHDSLGREIRDLRVSVTDRCNFQCVYCKPQLEGHWKPRSELLRFEEIERLVRIFVEWGIHKVRLTGGEPLVRHEIEHLIARLAQEHPHIDLCMTTNAYALTEKVSALVQAGLKRVSVSLDTLDAKKFFLITGQNHFQRVLDGIEAAVEAGLHPVKVNAVIVRGINDDEILDFARFAREHRVVFRFIEFMPLDADHQWSRDRVVTMAEIVERVESYKKLVPLPQHQASETARRYTFEDGVGEIGIIAPVSRPFCGHCSRIRVTADGKIRTCLFSVVEHDIKALMREGASDQRLIAYLHEVVYQKEPRHHINDPDFVQPTRDMSLIGG